MTNKLVPILMLLIFFAAAVLVESRTPWVSSGARSDEISDAGIADRVDEDANVFYENGTPTFALLDDD